MRIVKGDVIELLSNLPIPNKVFIGGSGKSLDDIIKIAFEKNPQVSLRTNAITLETLNRGILILESLGLEVEVIQVMVNKGNKKGSYHLMMSENPSLYYNWKKGVNNE